MFKSRIVLGLCAALLLLPACNSVTEPASPSADASMVLEQAQGLQAQKLAPDELAVPAGNVLFSSLIGAGTQRYVCDASGEWTFVAPRAKLYSFNFRKVGTHFDGPTWKDRRDKSTVVGSLLEAVPAPFSLDGQPAIPWLLVEAASTTPARNDKDGTFTPTTFIRRLFTVGGVAPTAGCNASTVGKEVGVPYTSLYEFYRSQHN